ncbi:MAG: hypothetical protein IJT94_13290 [Oscillibacter sp.]|nr:hypothetical protein [Oscillibacter sp.]
MDSNSDTRTETVRTDRLYLRGGVLEWSGRLIQLDKIQSVAVHVGQPPEYPASADKTLARGKRFKRFGPVLCVVGAVLLVLCMALHERTILTLALAVFSVLLAAGGVLLYRAGRSETADAEALLETWRTARDAVEHALEIDMVSGGSCRILFDSPVFLERVYQFLSSHMENPEDPDGRYEIHLDDCKLYRVKRVAGRRANRAADGRTDQK